MTTSKKTTTKKTTVSKTRKATPLPKLDRNCFQFEILELASKQRSKSKKVDGIYNCGGGKSNSISILELIFELEKLIGKKLNLNFLQERKSDQKIFIYKNNK